MQKQWDHVCYAASIVCALLHSPVTIGHTNSNGTEAPCVHVSAASHATSAVPSPRAQRDSKWRY